MARIDIGLLETFTHTRYTITLSDSKRLVLFRLPKIPSADSEASRQNETSDGWTYYAMEAECPHAGGPMADAQVDIEDSSYIASCPWHAYDFNLETGKSSYGVKACTFPVIVQGGTLCIELPAGATDVTVSKLDAVSEQVKFKHGPRPGAGETQASESQPGDDATLCGWCVYILNTSDPERKIELTTKLFSIFATREESSSPMEIGAGSITPPEEPPRENKNQVRPGGMPRSSNSGASLKSRISMIHALANIEQWAIDLAIDICVRFASFTTTEGPERNASRGLPRTFFYDWLKVANDEAKHFSLLRARLEDLGTEFGALPVHHALWESAARTAHDLRARISVIALVHEARGLDVNPLTMEKFRKAGDVESVGVMDIIHNDEITHVTTGHRWLSWICEQEGSDPVQVFRGNVQKYFKGAVKGPFNAEARLQAGMDATYYEGLGGHGVSHVLAGG